VLIIHPSLAAGYPILALGRKSRRIMVYMQVFNGE